MHQACSAHHLPAVDIPHALVSKTDTKNGIFPRKRADHITTDPRLFRCAGARGDANPLRSHRLNLLDTDLVVAMNHGIGSQFPEILDEIVGEGIVVVEDEDHGEFQCNLRSGGNPGWV